MIQIKDTKAYINDPSDYKGLFAISVRLEPNEEQKTLFNKTFGCCRVVLNDYISNKKVFDSNFFDILKLRASKQLNKNVEDLTIDEINSVKEKDEYLYNYVNAYNDYKNKKSLEEYSWLSEINSKVIQQALRDTQDAFNNYYRDSNVGYPKFKTKHDDQSCRFPLGALKVKSIKYYDDIKQKTKYILKANCIDDNKLSFGNKILLNIKFRCSYKDFQYLNRNQDKIHSITITKNKCGEYYASILIDDVERKQLLKICKSVGLDMGIKDFCVDSDGKRFVKLSEYNKHVSELENKKKYLDKKLSRLRNVYKDLNKKNNKNPNFIPIDYNKSKRYNKVKRQHAKVCKQIADIRENYLQTTSYYYVNNYDIICIENLSVKNMVKNHKLARVIMSCGWGRFAQLLEEKCNRYGKTLIKINRFYGSSKTCNNCGYYYEDLTLDLREWYCPDCGCVIDRDYNAACNILEEGLRCLQIYKESC